MPYAARLLTATVALLVATGAAFAQAPPLPPVRPPASVPAPAAPPAAGPAATPAAARQGAALDQSEIVQRANAFLNSLTTLTGDFAQTGGDGRQYRGRLYVQKPGKLRFEYNPPAVIEVVSDGTSVIVRDRKLATQDLYAIGQTPLKFLLKEQLDLSRDTTVLRASADGDNASVTLEDRNTLGGVSRITLTFDSKSFALKNWRIRDPQGHDTFVALSNIDTSSRPDPGKFRIDYQRDLGR
ncbi:MAG: outer-membrane lipoprotein carrier protein LolA [Beijerinckiaceae bacterium]